MKNFIKPASILALAAALCSCASPEPEPIWRPAPLPSPTPMEILIETSPAGGLVDWNGDVLGVAPVTLTITPRLVAGGRPAWPDTGNLLHIFRSRWPNGKTAFEHFRKDALPPQRVAIICPAARNPLLDSLRADAKTLTQKKTP